MQRNTKRLVQILVICCLTLPWSYCDDVTAEREEAGYYLCKVTAYTPWDAGCSGLTAWRQKDVRESQLPGAAVDRRAIPYGTTIFVPEYGWTICDDTGSAMRTSWRRDGLIHIDVRVYSTVQARAWGVKWLWVKIPR